MSATGIEAFLCGSLSTVGVGEPRVAEEGGRPVPAFFT